MLYLSNWTGLKNWLDWQGLLLVKIVKLLVGALLFMILCTSGGMFLVLALQLSGNLTNGRYLISLLLVFTIFLVTSLSLYFLSRKAPEAELGETARVFKSRKLVFQLLIIGLIAIFIVATASFAGASPYPGVEAGLIFAMLVGAYIFLAKRLWRCPACKAQLPFRPQEQARQSIMSCPVCQERLQ